MSIVHVDGNKPKAKLTTIWGYVIAAGLFIAFVINSFTTHTFNVHWRGATPTFLAWQKKAWSTFVGWTGLCTVVAIVTFEITYGLLWNEIKDQSARCRQAVYYALLLHALSMTGWLIVVLKNLVVAVSH